MQGHRRTITAIMLVLCLCAPPWLASGTTLSAAPTGELPDGLAGANPLDRDRGVVMDALRPGRRNGPCVDQFEIVLDEATLCTHGPDPAPLHVDVTQPRSVLQLAVGDGPGNAGEPELATNGLQCFDDGTSGNRVQAVYARSADVPSRFASIKPLIPGWAAAVDGVFLQSAQALGAERYVRWVTDPDCSLSVIEVVLSESGDDNVNNTITELKKLRYARPDRKYLVWMDATVYCGIAQQYLDDRPDQSNANNGYYPMFARVDSGCWGLSAVVEAHELVHTLGGVQSSAPNATTAGHCYDEYDLMCYNDGSGFTMTYTGCPNAVSDTRLDCGNDDYFNPDPPDGSYLATHWNTADNSFLVAAAPAPTPGPTPTPTPTPAPTPAPTGDSPTVSPEREPTTTTARGRFRTQHRRRVHTAPFGEGAVVVSAAGRGPRASIRPWFSVRVRSESGDFVVKRRLRAGAAWRFEVPEDGVYRIVVIGRAQSRYRLRIAHLTPAAG